MKCDYPRPQTMVTNAEALPYREQLDELLHILAGQGNLACILIDLSQLCQVERNYGAKAFEKVLDSATEIISKLKGSEVRASDILATNDRGGDAVLISSRLGAADIPSIYLSSRLRHNGLKSTSTASWRGGPLLTFTSASMRWSGMLSY